MRPQGPSQTPTQRIKFLINVPMWVPLPDSDHPQEEIMSQCQRLLTLLEQTGFSKIDKQRLVDVAVVIGLNGKDSPALRKLLKQLVKLKEKTCLKFQKVTYTWGPEGDIKYNKESTPYQYIREYLKNHEETKKLVRELRGNDDECLVYFSFIDGDIQDFNHVYSSYLEIVKKHSVDHDNVPPTVMSTGYEFPKGDFQPASQIDREIRIETAEHFPLGTYYPEPNFCVLLPLGEDTLPESFISKGKSSKQNKESPTLIRDVKKRVINFTSLFVKGNPVITAVPARCVLSKDKLVTSQSHYKPMVWATGALIHGQVEYNRGNRGDFGKMRGILMRMLTRRTDEEFEKEQLALSSYDGPGVEPLISAALAVREHRQQLEQSQNEKKRAEQAEP